MHEGSIPLKSKLLSAAYLALIICVPARQRTGGSSELG